MRYCIWNNKGGVGKTFLTYCLATEYAIKHPNKAVAVIDMCPQANVSEMLLGGDGLGEDNLEKCNDHSRTIASYIKNRYDKSRFGKLGDDISYFVKVQSYNSKMPPNLYLVPGDIDLDLCSLLIDYMAQAPEKGAWAKSRSFVKDLVDVFEDSRDHKGDKVFFIDSNPSFANYTQLGLIASERIIVPCTADSASIRGIHNILRLVFGVKNGLSSPSEDVFDTFSSKLRDIGGVSPKIHAFILNKARTKNKSSSKAYVAHADNIRAITSKLVSNHVNCFTETLANDRVFEMKDCNTIAPVMNYNGMLPSELRKGSYEVYDERAKVNKTQLTPFMENLNQIIDCIDR